MSSREWHKYKLGQIINDIAMGPFGSNIKVENFVDSGVPVIRGINLNENGFVDEKFVYVSEAKAQSLKRSLAFPDDLVFTHRGTIGQVGIIPRGKHPKYLVSQSQMKLTVNTKYLDPLFLYYFFKSPLGQYELLKNSSQVGVPAIAQPTASLKAVDIFLPPLPTQRRIAEILSALDDKIELNRQTNATLEAIAQAIFKEWFVDFNFPGATGELVESELGLIPKGWRVGRLGEVCELIRGVSYSSDELQQSNKALVTLKSINRGGGFNINGFKEYSGRYKSLQCLDEGDLIFAQTDITQNADVIGSPAIVENPFNYEKLIASLDIVKCVPTNEMPDSQTLFYFLKQQEFKEYCLSQTNGSTVLHLRSSEVPNYSMIIPSPSILRTFSALITSYRRLILENNRQNQILIDLRDTLLPKLMSGEIEV